MVKYLSEWREIAEEQGVDLETYNDELVVFRSSEEKATSSRRYKRDLVGVALDRSYEKFQKLGMDSFYLPDNYSEIEESLSDRDYAFWLRNFDSEKASGEVRDEINDMFYEEEELLDLVFEGAGAQSHVFGLEKDDEMFAVETTARESPYIISEFLSLYTAQKALEEISQDLNVEVSAVEPYFSNPFFFFEEHAGDAELDRGEYSKVKRHLDRADYRYLYRRKGEGLLKELEPPLDTNRFLSVDMGPHNMAENGSGYYVIDGGIWQSKWV